MPTIDKQFLHRSEQILARLQSEYDTLLSQLTTARCTEYNEKQKQIERNLEQQKIIAEYLRSVKQ